MEEEYLGKKTRVRGDELFDLDYLILKETLSLKRQQWLHAYKITVHNID